MSSSNLPLITSDSAVAGSAKVKVFLFDLAPVCVCVCIHVGQADPAQWATPPDVGKVIAINLQIENKKVFTQ